MPRPASTANAFARSIAHSRGVVRLKPKRASMTKVRQAENGSDTRAPPAARIARNAAKRCEPSTPRAASARSSQGSRPESRTANGRFALLQGAFGAALMFAVLLSGLLPWLDREHQRGAERTLEEGEAAVRER